MKVIVTGTVMVLLLTSVSLQGSFDMWSWKKILAPWSNATKEVVAARLWAVRWQARYGEFHSDLEPTMEAFPTQAAAEEFATALRNAFKLLKHSGRGTKVTVGEI